MEIYYREYEEGKVFEKVYFSRIIIDSYRENIINKIIHKFLYIKLYKYIIGNGYNFIYLRYSRDANPALIYFLKKLKKKGIKVIIEFPNYPYDEEQIPQNFFEKISIWLDKKYRKKLKYYVEKAVVFADEKEAFGISTISLENGINLDKIKLINKENKKDINLIIVANIQDYHGCDRVILSLREFYKKNRNEDVYFHIIGDGDKKVILKLKNQVKENNMEKYIIFYGNKSGEELEKIYDKVDLGVGCLGLFRAKSDKTSALKHREYCAKGIPFMIAGLDKSFNSCDFVYSVSNDESLLDIEKIIKWYKNLKVTPEEIRKYAEDNLTWDKQMKKVIDNI